MFALRVVSSLFLLVALAQCREFQFLNNRGDTIWVGIQGNPGHAHLEGGGFSLSPGERRSTHTADNWAGRFWGRTGCGSNGQCETGNCGGLQCEGRGGNPPATLAEITLAGWGGLDYYDISLVDGFNIQTAIEPLGGQGDGGQYSCKRSACFRNLNDECPNELKQVNGGRVTGCKSACLAFNTDQYCCRNAHSRPETCRSSDWPTNYPKFFKDRCPDGYSYAYDDNKSTFTCKAPAYLITFA